MSQGCLTKGSRRAAETLKLCRELKSVCLCLWMMSVLANKRHMLCMMLCSMLCNLVYSTLLYHII
jgi:hypothetical protein